MIAAAAANLPAHRSREEILAHPQFAAARNAMLDAMLGLYEHDPFLNRLLLEAGRNVVFTVVMCLHARSDAADPATWPTLRLLKREMAGFGLASPRRIADLVSRLVKTGYLEQRPAAVDRRIRILSPTEKMIEQDLDWLESHYVPLQLLYPKPGYGPIMQRDRKFQQTHRLVAASLFPYAAQLLARNPLMVQFMVREAGMMILIKLLQLAGSGKESTAQISYSDIGARFGVSRTQVGNLLQEAEQQGLMRLTRGRGHLVQLTPPLIEAFDAFIADTMAGHDLVYQLAQRPA
jgi:DNA-binding MarR family transcriptional regulator